MLDNLKISQAALFFRFPSPVHHLLFSYFQIVQKRLEDLKFSSSDYEMARGEHRDEENIW